jgi:hypothetical protein
MKYFSIVAVGLVLVFATVASAGVLNGHTDAYNGWSGSVPFVSGTLTGDIDYAVFTAADFNTNFGGAGYVPDEALVYTYQIESTGGSFLSAEIVGIANPTGTAIGTFNNGVIAGNKDASASVFDVSGNAVWQFFAPNNIPTGESSYGLAFSSPNAPMSGVGVILNGGQNALQVGLPTPSADPIPEPCSLLLLAVGGVLVARGHRFRRRLR